MTIPVHPEAKALIFDLDGTLSNSLPVHVHTWKVIGEKYGFDFDPQIIYEMTGRPTIEFAIRIIDQYGVNEKPEVLVKMKQESFWKLGHMIEPIEDTVAIVNNYYGKLPMAVGTGASRTSAEVQLKALGIIDKFQTIVSANDVKEHKPDPKTFLECAKIMGIEPKFCQVFEDGDLGIEAAKRGGMLITDVRDYIEYGDWINK
jgi:beta-phosphoglucomutase family hydrolase